MRLQDDPASPFVGLYSLEGISVLKAKRVADSKLVAFSFYDFKPSRPNGIFPVEAATIMEFGIAELEVHDGSIFDDTDDLECAPGAW